MLTEHPGGLLLAAGLIHEGMNAMAKVTPLQKRTMTLSKLQMRTLDVLRAVRFQMSEKGYNNMSDNEFLDQVIEPLETDIYQDRQVRKMARTKP